MPHSRAFFTTEAPALKTTARYQRRHTTSVAKVISIEGAVRGQNNVLIPSALHILQEIDFMIHQRNFNHPSGD